MISPSIKLIVKLGLDKQRINLFISNKIAALIPDKDNKAKFYNIMVYNRMAEGYSDELFIIPPGNPVYIALLYPLLFPHDITGWYYECYLCIDPKSGHIRKALII